MGITLTMFFNRQLLFTKVYTVAARRCCAHSKTIGLAGHRYTKSCRGSFSRPLSHVIGLNGTTQLNTIIATLTLSLILSITTLLPAFAKGMTEITNPNTLFDFQQAYGKKVQLKTKVKQSTLPTKLFSKTNKTNKANLFKTKSFYNSKTALKQFQVQFKVGNSYNVQQFGAKGDGITDDQNAINQAIARATGTGLSVYFPPGNYLHSGLIVSNGVALYGAGSSTTLTATNSVNGAIELTGSGAGVSKLMITYQNPSPVSYSAPDTMPQAGAIWIQSANSFLVDQVTINSSSNNGIDTFQASNGTVSNTSMNNIPNDGISLVDCNSVQVLSNYVQGVGFYALSVYYGTTGSTNLTISYNQFYSTNDYNDFISGVQSCQITHNVFSTVEYGLFLYGNSVGASPGYGPISDINIANNTFPSFGGGYNYINDISLTGNTVNNIQFVNNAFPIQNYNSLDVSGNNINVSSNSNLSFIDIRGGNNINCSSNTLFGSNSGNAFYVYHGSNIVIQNNQIGSASSGIGGSAIFVDNLFPPSVGPIQISNNQIANSCTAGTANVIDVENDGTVVGLSITGNNYAGPTNSAQYYIQCLYPGFSSSITGNTQATALPNNIAP